MTLADHSATYEVNASTCTFKLIAIITGWYFYNKQTSFHCTMMASYRQALLLIMLLSLQVVIAQPAVTEVSYVAATATLEGIGFLLAAGIVFGLWATKKHRFK